MPDDNNRKDDFGNLRRFVTGAPLLTGAGFAAWRAAREWPKSNVLRDGIAPASKYLNQVAPYGMGAAQAINPVANFTNYLTGITNKVAKEEMLFAWEMAANSLPVTAQGGISPERFTNPFSSMVQAMSGELPRLNPGDRARFINTFKSNINMMEANGTLIGNSFLTLEMMRPSSATFDPNKSYIRRTLEGTHQLPASVRSYAERLQSHFGNLDIVWKSRPEWNKYKMGTFEMSFGSGLSLNVPMSSEGMILTGKNLTGVAAVGEFGVFDETTRKLQRMSPGEYLLHRATSGDLGELTPQKLRDLQADLRRRHIALPAVPLRLQGAGTRGYGIQKGAQINLVTTEGKTITGPQALRIPEIEKLIDVEFFSGPSPGSMLKGRLSTKDLSQLYLTPEAVPMERRPGQMLRDATYTSGIPTINDKNYSWIFSDEMKKMYGEVPAELHQAIFLKENEISKLSGKHITAFTAGDGEAEISRATRNMASRSIDKNIKLARENEFVAQMFMEGGKVTGGRIPAGTPLGFDEFGSPVIAPRELEITGYDRLGTSAQPVTHLYTRQFVGAERHAKMFGIKAGLIERPQSTFTKTSKALGLSGVPTMRAEIGILGKERHMLNYQMATSLWGELSSSPQYTRMQGVERFLSTMDLTGPQVKRYTAELAGLRQRLAPAMAMIQDPAKFVTQLGEHVTKGGKFSHAKFTAGLMGVAMEAGIEPTKFGRIFGAASEVFGDDWYSTLREAGAPQLSAEYQKAVTELSPMGVVFGARPGPKELRLGAGKAASMEPRMFTALEAGQFGDLGEKLANELALRTTMNNPQALVASEELRKSLQSFTGSVGFEGNIFRARDKFSREIFTEFMAGGGMLDIGMGKPSVYVPSMENVKQLIPFQVRRGDELVNTYSDFAKNYMDLAEASHKAHIGTISPAEFEKVYLNSMQNLQKEHAIFGKQSFGLFRSNTQRVTGSAFLELETNPLFKQGTKSVNAVGISEHWFGKMMGDLEKHGSVTKEEVAHLRARFKSGKPVAGMWWGHPVIGQYSVMPVQFFHSPGAGKAPVAHMPEIFVDMPTFGKKVNISPVLAAARDKDEDVAAFMLLEGDLEKQARNFLRNKQDKTAQRYVDHMFRMNFLKPKAIAGVDAAEVVTVQDLGKVAIEKLGMAKEHTPFLSTELTRAKLAVAASPDPKRMGQALTLLEFFEQIPISGKHVPAEQLTKDIRAFERQFVGLQDALKMGDAEKIRGFFLQTLGKTGDKPIVQQLIGKGVKITNQELSKLRKAMGSAKLEPFITGLDIEGTSKYIAEAIRTYRDAPASDLSDLVYGRRKIRDTAELSRYLSATKFKTPGAGFVARATEGAGAVMSKAGVIASNLKGVSGRMIGRALKPLGLGALTTMGLSMLFSTPEPSVNIQHAGATPEGAILNRASNDRYVAPEDLMPPVHLGNPQAPGRIMTPTAEISPGISYNITGDFNAMAADVDPEAFAQQIELIAGSNTNMNVLINDRRRRTNRDEILNELAG